MNSTKHHQTQVSTVCYHNMYLMRVGNTLELLRAQLHEIQKEIRADSLGKKEFEDQLDLLKRQKSVLQKRYVENKKWADEFGKGVVVHFSC